MFRVTLVYLDPLGLKAFQETKGILAPREMMEALVYLDCLSVTI